MASIVINSKGQFLNRGGGWSEALDEARVFTNKGAAKNSYRQVRSKEPVLVQEVTLLFWGSPEVYEPKK